LKNQDVVADQQTALAKLHRPDAQIPDEPFGFQIQSGLRSRLSINVTGVSILPQLAPESQIRVLYV
jgi:hypothetical protein